jgi:putative DNA primase/helicase
MSAPVPKPAEEALTGMLQCLPGSIDAPAQAVPPTPPAKPPSPPGNGDGDDLQRGDIALATRFVADHRDRVFYCPSWDRWHVWDGKRWKADDEGVVVRLAEQTMLDYARELTTSATSLVKESNRLQDEAAKVYADESAGPAAREDADKKAARARSLRKQVQPQLRLAESIQALKKLRDMIELAKSRVEIVVRGELLDADAYLLNCDNGVVDLRDGRLYTHDPKRRITRLCPVPYLPDTKPGRLQEIFDHLFQRDADLVRYAQEILGNSLQGGNRLEKFHIWFGPGGGGKGALMEGVKATIGDYCMTAEYKTFISVQGHRVRDDLARLAEARLVLSSEVKKGETWDTAVLKSMTGNDTVAARQLYGSYFEFRPRLTLHLQCNDLPRADDQDSGLWRRVVVIPCGPEVPDDKKDPTLKEYLLDPERGGRAILAWLVAGAIRTHSARRIDEPDVVKRATAQYRQDQDPLKEYIEHRVRFALTTAEHHERTRVVTTDLVKDYRQWATEQGVDRRFQVSSATLGKHLEPFGVFRKKARLSATTTADAWHGVTLPHQDHALGAQTFIPSEAEHEQALESVPLFRSSAGLEKSSRARARSTSRRELVLDEKNKGTKEQTPDAGSAPADGSPIDLGNLP